MLKNNLNFIKISSLKLYFNRVPLVWFF